MRKKREQNSLFSLVRDEKDRNDEKEKGRKIQFTPKVTKRLGRRREKGLERERTGLMTVPHFSVFSAFFFFEVSS